MNAEGKRWISVREAAKLLGCHYQTAFDWIRRGILPAARIGPRFIRVDGQALGRLLEAQIDKQSVMRQRKGRGQ